MMIEKIIKLLKASDAHCWKIQKNTVNSEEYFFVKEKMDLGRAKRINRFDVTVYKDFSQEDQQYRGSSSVTLSSLLSTEELKEAIDGAVFAAGFVKNPWYPITEPYIKNFTRKACELEKLSKDCVEAILKTQNDTKAWINSAELFINDIHTRILNSKGLDVSFSKYQTYLETIVSATGEEEVELYDELKISIPDNTLIRKRIFELLSLVHERSIAQNTPTLEKLPVILTGEPVKEFMRYFFQQANSKMKYDKISQAEVGKSIQGKEIGDKITMDILAQMEWSYYNSPVDDDGFMIKSENIIENGLLKKYWGDLRYSYYLGIKPTGMANNFKISPGEKSVEQLKTTPHLEVTHFSAIDADMNTGDFGGEIRLGWYHDGSKKVPVTGGSVTGNIRELSSMKLSKETHLEGDYFGPCSIKIEGFKISGE